MASAAEGAFGTLLKIGDGGTSESFTTIAEVTDITFELMQNTIDVTNHSSTGGWGEKIGGVKNMQASFECNWQPTAATHSQSSGGFVDDLRDGTLRNFQLVWPDSGTTTWAFSALIGNVAISANHADKLTGSVTLEPSGQPTLAG